MSQYSFTGCRSYRPQFETLEDRVTPADLIAFSADVGGGPHVKVFDAETGTELHSLFAYDPTFRGGVRVGWGDITGDGKADLVTAPGSGGGPHIKVFDGHTFEEVQSYFAYDPAFTGGVWLSVGDINGDQFVDIITGTGPGGGPHVKAFSGKDGSELLSFFAYAPEFRGGVHVAGGNTDGEGRDEIITGAWEGGGPHVRVFDAGSLAVENDFFAYDPGFRGGVWVTAGDISGDGKFEILTSPGTGAGTVRVFDAASSKLVTEYHAADPGFTGGIRVSSRGDSNGDGHHDPLTVLGPGGSPSATVWDGVTVAGGQSGGGDAEPDQLVMFPVFNNFDGGVFASGRKMIILSELMP